MSRPLARATLTAVLWLSACLPSGDRTLERGDPVPDFSAASLEDGRTVSLADYAGQTLLVNLWATWCHPCKAETPYLQSLFEEHRDRGLRIAGVSIDRSADRDAVIDFVEEMGVTYDILLDPQANSTEVFQARGLPNSVLIDAAGTVVFSWLGPIPEGDPTFLRGLEATLGVSGGVATQSGS